MPLTFFSPKDHNEKFENTIHRVVSLYSLAVFAIRWPQCIACA